MKKCVIVVSGSMECMVFRNRHNPNFEGNGVQQFVVVVNVAH